VRRINIKKLTFLALPLLLTPAFGHRAPNKQLWPLWESYTTHFYDGRGRIVDWDAEGRTTSEAQSYALFFALVANDRVRFEKLLSWTQQNLGAGDLKSHLPSWLWQNRVGGQKVVDIHSASDADLWLAYTLLEAGRLWNEPRFTDIGRALAERVANDEIRTVPGLGPMLLPGATGFETADGSYELNPSYLPLQLFLGLSHHLGSSPWSNVAAAVPRVLKESAPHGFVLDWIAYREGEGFSTLPVPVGEPAASYDAIRVYLWTGMLPSKFPFGAQVKAAVSPMRAYMHTHPIPPAVVTGRGVVKDARGSVGFSAAVMPLLSSLHDDAALQVQKRRLDSERNARTGLYGKNPRYYDQNLALFATGWLESRFRFDERGLLQVNWK
jgi:endo-1,4-beta-D-glucanase Y